MSLSSFSTSLTSLSKLAIFSIFSGSKSFTLISCMRFVTCVIFAAAESREEVSASWAVSAATALIEASTVFSAGKSVVAAVKPVC